MVVGEDPKVCYRRGDYILRGMIYRAMSALVAYGESITGQRCAGTGNWLMRPVWWRKDARADLDRIEECAGHLGDIGLRRIQSDQDL